MPVAACLESLQIIRNLNRTADNLVCYYIMVLKSWWIPLTGKLPQP